MRSSRRLKRHETATGYILDTNDSGPPIGALVVLASLHDSQVVSLSKATSRYPAYYDLMDAVYDA